MDETLDADLVASVMDSLNARDSQPPQDEYATNGDEAPPAYFRDAYMQWRTADKAKLALIAHDKDPAVKATNDELEEAREVLKDMKVKSEEAFKAMHAKRLDFKKVLKWGKSPPQDPQDVEREKFRIAHEAEMNQAIVVENLEGKATKLILKRAELANMASAGNFAWNQLRQVVDETAPDTPEFTARSDTLLGRLDAVENVYSVAKQTAADLARARLAVQSGHGYLTRALTRYDSVRGPSKAAALIGGFSGGMGELNNMSGYRVAVFLASKAQICLNEMFRVLSPHEDLIPAERMEDYRELKDKGVLQMSKIYNLVFGGRFLDSGRIGSIKLMQERQEAAFAHLTYLGVWVQSYAPTCLEEEEKALIAQNDVRRELAAFWNDAMDISSM